MHTTKPRDLDAVVCRDSFLADVGELAGPLSHEINNLLNTVTLHLALMKQAAPENLASDMQTIRQHISRFGEIMLQYQRYRDRYGLEPALFDVNTVARRVIDETSALHAHLPIVGELQPDLPRIRGYEADFRRLCRLLLVNATRAVSPSGPAVMVRTLRRNGVVVLRIEDGGADVPNDALDQFFELGPRCREGMCCLELAACRSIVRRMNGGLQAEGRPGGGLVVSVQFSAVP